MKHGNSYDIIIVGGGLGGSTLAKSLAEGGIKVLVLERESVFKDRVRGEGLHPWGVTETRVLGIYDLLMNSCAQEVRWWVDYADGNPIRRRDVVATNPHQSGEVTFYHPEMQAILLKAAVTSGAEVRRDTRVHKVIPGKPPCVLLKDGSRLHAQLVVGADGRNSNVRTWGGFQVNRDLERLRIAGVLLEGLRLSSEEVHFATNFSIGQVTSIFPLTQQRFRCYVIIARRNQYPTLSGRQHIPDFIGASLATGALKEWYSEAKVMGPLAVFEAADSWVEHPYQNGVVLIGDAAASPDPSWGCGLSLTLRDVRVLRDKLLANDDWLLAANLYAHEHNRYYGILHQLEEWLTDLLYAIGQEADVRRERVFERHQEEPDRMIDIVGVGPDAPNDKITQARFFAED